MSCERPGPMRALAARLETRACSTTQRRPQTYLCMQSSQRQQRSFRQGRLARSARVEVQNRTRRQVSPYHRLVLSVYPTERAQDVPVQEQAPAAENCPAGQAEHVAGHAEAANWPAGHAGRSTLQGRGRGRTGQPVRDAQGCLWRRAACTTKILPAQLVQPLQNEQLLARPEFPQAHAEQPAQLPASVDEESKNT